MLEYPASWSDFEHDGFEAEVVLGQGVRVELDVHPRLPARGTVVFALLLPCQNADVVGFLRYCLERVVQGLPGAEDLVAGGIEAGDGAAHDALC